MAPVTVFKRYEKKYLIDEEAMARMLPEIRLHMEEDANCRDGRTYQEQGDSCPNIM